MNHTTKTPTLTILFKNMMITKLSTRSCQFHILDTNEWKKIIICKWFFCLFCDLFHVFNLCKYCSISKCIRMVLHCHAISCHHQCQRKIIIINNNYKLNTRLKCCKPKIIETIDCHSIY